MNGTLQDRLVKELRLAGISDIERANRFLEGKYLRAFHRQFGREAASPLDVHRAVPRNLEEMLSWEEERVVQGGLDGDVRGKRYQLDRQHEAMSLVRRKVIVRRLCNGRVQLVHRGKALKWRALPAGAPRKQGAAKQKPAPRPTPKANVPAAAHPWRRRGVGAGRPYGNGIKARGGAAGGAGLRSASAPLRLPCVPHPQPEQRTTNHQGTFSRELNRGHF